MIDLASVVLSILAANPPAPCGPVPSDRQLDRMRLETCGLVHLGVPTFLGRDFATDADDPAVFRLESLAATEWVENLRAMGLDGIVLVVRDSDGFSLAETAIVPEVARVLAAARVPFGISLGSAADGAGLATEVAGLCDRFGPFFEVRLGSDVSPAPLDGRDVACADACISSATGPDFVSLPLGMPVPVSSDAWLGVERAVSLRPSWYWKRAEDDSLRDVTELEEAWFTSVGQGESMLIGIPAGRDGRFRDRDVERVRSLHERLAVVFAEDLARSAQASASSTRGDATEFAAARAVDGSESTFWATDDGTDEAWFELTWDRAVAMNTLELREPGRLGRRCHRWSAEARIDGRWSPMAEGDTIGIRRTVRFGTVMADGLRVRLFAPGCSPALSRISVFAAPPDVRLVSGDRSFHAQTTAMLGTGRTDVRIRYTLDGRDPIAFGTETDGAIRIDASCLLRAIAVDAAGRAGHAMAVRFTRIDGDPFLESWPEERIGRPLQAGLDLELHDGVETSLEELRERRPRSTGVVTDVRLPADRPDDRFALVFRGFLRVPEDGLYTFALRSDDGSRLFLHDRLVVDRDGGEVYEVREGRVALRRGLHPFRLEYCEFAGRESLSLSWAAADATLARVPASAFAR